MVCTVSKCIYCTNKCVIRCKFSIVAEVKVLKSIRIPATFKLKWILNFLRYFNNRYINKCFILSILNDSSFYTFANFATFFFSPFSCSRWRTPGSDILTLVQIITILAETTIALREIAKCVIATQRGLLAGN